MGMKTWSSRWSQVTVRNAPAAAKLAPAAPALPSASLAPPPPSGPPDGLLKATEKDSELQIIITPDPATVSYDSFVLLLDDKPQGSPYTFDSTTDFPTFTMPLAATDRTEGPHQLSYRIDYFSGTADTSDPTPLMVDLHYAGSPDTLPALTGFDPRVISEGLSLDLLTELGDKVEATLGAYGGSDPYSSPAPGDVITPYIGTIAGDPIILGSITTQNNTTVTFTKAHIEQVAADGKHDFYYTVADRAGNLSPSSFVQSITILLKSGIDNFLEPVIDAAGSTSGDIILEAEARAGVQVTIPGHPDLLENDEVTVVWDGTDQDAALVPAPGADTEFDITVEWTALAPKGSGNFKVSYYVKRNGGLLGRSPEITVAVNIDIPGGPDTNPDTPENDNLSKLTVVGDADGIDNEITIDDSLLGAKATVPWLQTDGTTEYLKDGDVIYLLWNGAELPDNRPVTNADVIAKDDIVIPIPSATLLLTSGLLDVSYKVTRAVTAVPEFNSAYSPVQAVDVKSANGAPGGTSPLGESILPEEGILFNIPLDAWVINVKVLQGGTPVEIPHYLNKKGGDIINITFTAKGGLDGSGPDFPDAKWEVKDYPVPVGDEENESSFFTLPEANLKEVTPYGRGIITYSVKNDIATKNGGDIEVVIDNRGGRS